jgi:hypothetical protein
MKKQVPHCLRCGIEKRKGFYEGGCSSWARKYERHFWNTRLKGGENKNENEKNT